MIKLISSELFKLRKRGLTWILLYIMIGVMVLINLITYAISNISLPNQPPGSGLDVQSIISLSSSIPFTLSMLASFEAVMAVILMASTVGNEYNWRTIRVALVSCEGRMKFLASKIISVIILVVIGMVISLVVGFIMSLITNSLAGNALNFDFITGTYLWNHFLQFWRTLFIIMPFILMGLLFAVVGRSAMPGIGIGIGILFLEPIITSLMQNAGGWVADIPKYLFSANVDAISALSNVSSSMFGGSSTQVTSVPQAFLVLGSYMVVFITMAFYLFKKRDVTV
jgi:ABC-2 type transport system permease protein